MFKEGVINVNKPAGWTSQDVCAKLRGRLRIKRIGHTGTLDPMATGVLPVCVGNATRIIEYYDHDRKSYHATMQLGIETDTLDITGEVLQEAEFSHVSEENIVSAFSDYCGEIAQIPPKYSALKINGRKAYELAREGKTVEISPRTITIFSNEITFFDLEKGIIEFDVCCSKGTYIRTMCDDIGRALGCGATMTALVRTSSGMFTLDDSHELAELIEMSDEELNECIIPADETIDSLGCVVIDDNKVIAASHGNEIISGYYRITHDTSYISEKGPVYRIYGSVNECDTFLGVGIIKKGRLQPRKVVIDPNSL